MLSREVPELLDLELLTAVGRLGSMTAVATEVGMSQQAVSLRVRKTERAVGRQLVVRTQRGCTLTRAGRLLVEWSAPLLDDARQLSAGLRTLRVEDSTPLRVASSLTIAEYLLPGWLLALHEQQARLGQPATSVELSAVNTDAVVEAVREGRADIGFIESPRRVVGVRSRTIALDDLVIAVAPGHPWARRRAPVTAAQLARTPLVRREPGSGSRQALDDALARALPPGTPVVEPVLEVSSPAAARAAAAGGLGPTAISERAIADDLALGRVVAVPTTGIDLRRPLRAVWTGDTRPPSAAARDLLALCTDRRAAPPRGSLRDHDAEGDGGGR